MMKTVSILNHVLGPVMRGPSSSHTAGAFHIGCLARSILGSMPRRAVVAFDTRGSYAVTYAAQGADRGFAMGLLGKPLTDESFFTALSDSAAAGLDLVFEVRHLARPDHPNAVELEFTAGDGTCLRLEARSIGGGEVQITRVDGRPVRFDGTAFETLVEVPAAAEQAARTVLMRDDQTLGSIQETHGGEVIQLTARHRAGLAENRCAELRGLADLVRIWQSRPVYFVQQGQPLFSSSEEISRLAEQRRVSLGELALDYECALLGMSRAEVLGEILRRYEIMEQSVVRGLDPSFTGLQLLPACAGRIYQAEAAGRLAVRSLHTRAAARALAVMHVDGAMGVICAAPTGGSAGVIPGALVTLAEERAVPRERMALALLAAGSIGLVLATRGTFAAEVAGCQVEIGASGAMAAAAVVDAVGGTARQACDAAAISFQNTMGTVCDLLHGMVEIPCHTRNAAAAASAFVNADLVLGGYPNPIPLDETIDAVCAVGRAMPVELRCTSLGGLAITPAALAMKRSPPRS